MRCAKPDPNCDWMMDIVLLSGFESSNPETRPSFALERAASRFGFHPERSLTFTMLWFGMPILDG
jgi:hypothetical protein